MNVDQMREYTVYFEMFGRKMKTRVIAESEDDARNKVIGKMKFHKIEKSNSEFNEAIDIMGMMTEIFGKPK